MIFYEGVLWSPKTGRPKSVEGGFREVQRLLRTRGGTVLGFGQAHLETYVGGEWLLLGELPHGVHEGTSISELLDGRILIMGGTQTNGFQRGRSGNLEADRADLATGAIFTLPALPARTEGRADETSPAARVLRAIASELEVGEGLSEAEVLSIIHAALEAGSDPKAQAKALFSSLEAHGDLSFRGREWNLWRAITSCQL